MIWRSNSACPRDSAPGASSRSVSVARLTTEGGFPAPTTRPGRRLRNTTLRVSSAVASPASRRKRVSMVSAAAASTDTSGIAPRAMTARIAPTVAGPSSASARMISQGTASSSSQSETRVAWASASFGSRRPSSTTGRRPSPARMRRSKCTGSSALFTICALGARMAKLSLRCERNSFR